MTLYPGCGGVLGALRGPAARGTLQTVQPLSRPLLASLHTTRGDHTAHTRTPSWWYRNTRGDPNSVYMCLWALGWVWGLGRGNEVSSRLGPSYGILTLDYVSYFHLNRSFKIQATLLV